MSNCQYSKGSENCSAVFQGDAAVSTFSATVPIDIAPAIYSFSSQITRSPAARP